MHTVNKQMDNETEWFSAISMFTSVSVSNIHLRRLK